jgi:hypothetical protein
MVKYELKENYGDFYLIPDDTDFNIISFSVICPRDDETRVIEKKVSSHGNESKTLSKIILSTAEDGFSGIKKAYNYAIDYAILHSLNYENTIKESRIKLLT